MDKKQAEENAKKPEFVEYDPNNPPEWSVGMDEEAIKEVFELSKLPPSEMHLLIVNELKKVHEQSLREVKEVTRAMNIIRRLKKP